MIYSYLLAENIKRGKSLFKYEKLLKLFIIIKISLEVLLLMAKENTIFMSLKKVAFKMTISFKLS